MTEKLTLKQKFKGSGISYLLMAPWLIVFLIFTIIPFIAAVILGFTNFNMLEFPKFTGLTNYFRLFFDDDVFTIALKNTMLLVVLTGPLGFLLSFVFAWGINEFKPKLRAFLTLTFYAPTLAGTAIFYIWRYIFDGDARGLMNSMLMGINLISEPIAWLNDVRYNMGIVIVVVMWMCAGAGFLAFIAGLQSLNPDLFEAGAIDGIKNRWQELWYITLPQMKPQILLGSVFMIAQAFSIGYQSSALTGFPSTDYSAHTVMLHIIDYAYMRYEMGYACAVQSVLFVMMLVSWYVLNKSLSKWGTD